MSPLSSIGASIESHSYIFCCPALSCETILVEIGLGAAALEGAMPAWHRRFHAMAHRLRGACPTWVREQTA